MWRLIFFFFFSFFPFAIQSLVFQKVGISFQSRFFHSLPSFYFEEKCHFFRVSIIIIIRNISIGRYFSFFLELDLNERIAWFQNKYGSFRPFVHVPAAWLYILRIHSLKICRSTNFMKFRIFNGQILTLKTCWNVPSGTKVPILVNAFQWSTALLTRHDTYVHCPAILRPCFFFPKIYIVFHDIRVRNEAPSKIRNVSF